MFFKAEEDSFDSLVDFPIQIFDLRTNLNDTWILRTVVFLHDHELLFGQSQLLPERREAWIGNRRGQSLNEVLARQFQQSLQKGVLRHELALFLDAKGLQAAD